MDRNSHLHHQIRDLEWLNSVCNNNPFRNHQLVDQDPPSYNIYQLDIVYTEQYFSRSIHYCKNQLGILLLQYYLTHSISPEDSH